jgi:hypothetical protein
MAAALSSPPDAAGEAVKPHRDRSDTGDKDKYAD